MTEQARAAAPATWVLVLTYNGREFVEKCLDSLRPARRQGCQILVVDNASTDGTPELVEREFPWVELVRNERNLGSPGGNNVGLRRAFGAGAEQIVLLNQDTFAAPELVDELVAAASRHPKAATVTAKVYFMDMPNVVWYAGGSCSTWTGRRRHTGCGRQDQGQYDLEREVSCPCACAMLISRRCFELVGPFEESLFLYGEEIELAHRISRVGLVNVFAPRARVWHKLAGNAEGNRRGDYLYYYSRNMLYQARRERPEASRPLAFANSALIVATMLASIATMRLSFLVALRALFQGVADFHRGRAGARPA